MTLRPIEPRDEKRIAEIIRKTFEEHGAPLIDTVYDDPRTDHIAREMEGRNAQYYVVEEAGNVVGGGGFYPTEGLPEGWVEIVKLYFAPEARGKGVGGKLFRHILAQARAAGYRVAYLESFEQFGKAVGMYKRAGFEELPHRMGHSGHGGTTIHMKKPLAADEDETGGRHL